MSRAGYLALGDQLATSAEPLIRNLVRLAPIRILLNLFGRLGLRGRGLVIFLPYAWLALFFLIPFVIVLKISFADQLIARPPYSALWELSEKGYLTIKLNLNNYRFLIDDALYWKAYLNSVKIAFVSALICLIVGYPMAYGMARADKAWRNILLMLVILPFWTSFLLRVYAWIGLLNNNGIINNALLGLGLIDQPIVMMKTDFAVYVGIVYSYLPFMILPLFTALEKMDVTLLEAAADLGCKPLKAFFTITIPLSMPGIIAGFSLVFIPALGEFVIPDLLGGTDTLMIGHVLWNEFFSNRAWPVASAVAIAMLLLVLVILYLQSRFQRAAEAP
ncbi:MAG: ABC transporter permease subunit [Gammaproteobacteria bacterium]|nr:ABC transporter permease subunit [Gammaproteobacteria bacterium]